MQNAERVRPLYFVAQFYYRVEHIAAVIIFEQHRYYFRVGFRAECEAALGQKFAQFEIVLYYAVMHHGKLFVAAVVGVRVFVARSAVRCPTRVTYARYALGLCAVRQFFELEQPPFGFDDFYAAIVRYRYAARVVAAVFEPLEPVYEYGCCLIFAGVSYYAAHVSIFAPRFGPFPPIVRAICEE